MTLFLCFIKFGKLLAGEHCSSLRWGDVILNEVKNLNKKIPRRLGMTLLLCFIKFGKLLAGEHCPPLCWCAVILNEVKNLNKKIPRLRLS